MLAVVLAALGVLVVACLEAFRAEAMTNTDVILQGMGSYTIDTYIF